MTVPALELTQFAVTEPAPGYWRATFDHPPTNLMNAVTAAELRAIVAAATNSRSPATCATPHLRQPSSDSRRSDPLSFPPAAAWSGPRCPTGPPGGTPGTGAVAKLGPCQWSVCDAVSVI